jgi:hypothetical protein
MARIFDQRPPSRIVASLTKILLGGRWSKIRAIEKFKAKNPSLLRKFVPKGGCAIPARPVFSGFLPKKAKKPQKTGLSQYGQPSPALKPPPGRDGGVAPKAKGNLRFARFPMARIFDQRPPRFYFCTDKNKPEEAAGQKFVP